MILVDDVALASRKSDFHSIVKATTVVMVAQVMARGTWVQIRTMSRNSPGHESRTRHVKHLPTLFLWIQRRVQEGRAVLEKVDGEQNVADVGTKHADGKRMWRCFEDICGFGFRTGTELTRSGHVSVLLFETSFVRCSVCRASCAAPVLRFSKLRAQNHVGVTWSSDKEAWKPTLVVENGHPDCGQCRRRMDEDSLGFRARGEHIKYAAQKKIWKICYETLLKKEADAQTSKSAVGKYV